MSVPKRKIYDCFAFFNELDLLEIRLRELWDTVDYFVIVEATRTFQKKPKPLYFQENKERYKAYQSKIIHIVVDKYPTFWTKLRPVTAWHYDDSQKENILRGLKDAAPDDLIIVSDLDEIPRADKVREYADATGIRVFEQYFCHYFMNYVCTKIHDYDGKAVAQRNRAGFGRWRGTVMLEKKLIKDIQSTRRYRDFEGPHIKVIEDGGWHFSYLGGIDMIMHKVQNWAHGEYNTEKINTRENVIQSVLDGRELFNDGSRFELKDIDSDEMPFPEELKRNRERWAHLLRTPEQLKAELSGLLNSNSERGAAATSL